MTDKRVLIAKESSPVALEEKICIYIEQKDIDKYVNLIKRTWPETKITAFR